MSLTAYLKMGNYAILMPRWSSRLRLAFSTIIKVVIMTTSSEFCVGLYLELYKKSVSSSTVEIPSCSFS